MAPLWKLLRSREETERWIRQFRGALRSVITNRQWTQERGFKAGWFTHNRCMFCVHTAAVRLEGPDPTTQAMEHPPLIHT